MYLVAFASLLPLVPPSLCLSDLPTVSNLWIRGSMLLTVLQILPLIQRSLTLSSPVQRTNVIHALISILETPSSPSTDTILHSSASSLVSALLTSSVPSPETPTSSKVRQSALACLALIPDTIRFEVLYKQKAEVIKELGKAVDDRIRDVRTEAVECRARWSRYGQAT